MSHEGLSQLLSRYRLDVSLAGLVVVLSVLLVGLSLFASSPLLLVIPLSAGAGGTLYLLNRRHREVDALSWDVGYESAQPLTLPPAVLGYLPSLVVGGLAVLTLWISLVGGRPPMVYLLTGVIGILVFVQILFVTGNRLAPGLVLAQILLAAVVIRLTALYAIPGFVGVDIWTHVTVFVDGIAQDGSLSALAGQKYILAPFYHVIGAVGALLLGEARHGVYLTLGLLVPLSALFVYATGRLLLPARWALLATAFYAFSDQFIRWGMHVIPTSLGLVFFLAAVYALTRYSTRPDERWSIVLLLCVSLAIVFTHQVSTVIVLILLAIGAGVALVTSMTNVGVSPPGGARTAGVLGGVFALTLVTTIVSWSITPFSSGTFLQEEITEFGRALTENVGFLHLASQSDSAAVALGGPEAGGSLLGIAVSYVELFGFALLLLTTVLGSLYMFNRDVAPTLTVTHLLTGVTLFVLVFGFSLFGFRALLPGRWVAFLYVSMALLGALGLSHVSRSGTRRVVLAVFVLVAIGYPTTMVVAEKATLDDPAFADQHTRFAYTESEIAAVDSISQGDPPADERSIATDHPYVSLFRRVGGYGYGASVLELGPEGPVGADAAVFRDYQSSGPVTVYRAPESPAFELGSDVESSVCPPGWNRAYANDQVTYCTAPVTAEVDE